MKDIMISVRVDPWLAESLKRQAAAEGNPMSPVLRRLLVEALANEQHRRAVESARPRV